jgi:hypothetical protein
VRQSPRPIASVPAPRPPEGPNTKLLTFADQEIISHDLLPLRLVVRAARITVLLFLSLAAPFPLPRLT